METTTKFVHSLVWRTNSKTFPRALQLKDHKDLKEDKGKDHQQALTFTCNNFCNFFQTLTQVKEDTVVAKAEVREDKAEVRVDKAEVKAEVREVLMAALMTSTHSNKWHSKLPKEEARVVATAEVKAGVKAEVKEVLKEVLMICMLNNNSKCRQDNKEDNTVSNSSNNNNKAGNSSSNNNNRVVINNNSNNNNREANREDNKA